MKRLNFAKGPIAGFTPLEIPWLKQRKSRFLTGFTLVELLIATAIFSVIILSMYSAFQVGLLSYRKIDSAFNIYQSARVIFSRIELELKNSFCYSGNDSNFKGDRYGLDFFSHVDAFDNKGQRNAGICRIKYNFTNSILQRSCYYGIDVLKENPNIGIDVLSSGIKEITFEYAAAGADPNIVYVWQELWPKENNEEQKKTLPLAIKIKLLLKEEYKKEKETEVEFYKTVSLPLAGE